MTAVFPAEHCGPHSVNKAWAPGGHPVPLLIFSGCVNPQACTLHKITQINEEFCSHVTQQRGSCSPVSTRYCPATAAVPLCDNTKQLKGCLTVLIPCITQRTCHVEGQRGKHGQCFLTVTKLQNFSAIAPSMQSTPYKFCERKVRCGKMSLLIHKAIS